MILLKIDVSTSSINPINSECLNTPTKLFKLSSLYFEIVDCTLLASVVASSTVKLLSYLNVVFKVIKVVSGSVITGLTEAIA